jgi:hypothetical protein
MANYQVNNNFGTTDKRKVGRTTAASLAPNLATPLNYTSINAMRARLTAINAGYFTTARLDQMSDNDMMFAIRQTDDLAGF